MPLRVGLTGGIGSGKTTVSNLFAALGVPVFDADCIAHEITHDNHPVLDQVKIQFGEQSITPEGDMDRNFMRDLVFNNAEKKAQLEAILHPAIRKIMKDQVEACSTDYCILSIPLLIETHQEGDVDFVLVIDAPEARRIGWIKKRSQLSTADIRKIISSQATREKRLALADDVIVNDTSVEALRSQVRTLHKKYLEKSHELNRRQT